MVPCGLNDAGVTRLSDHLERCPQMSEFKKIFGEIFASVFA